MRLLLLTLMSSAALLGAAQAGEMTPRAAQSIDLGPVKGVAYYTVEQNGLQLVATLAADEQPVPVRVSAILAPEQSLTVGVPGVLGQPETAISFARHGNTIVMAQAGRAAY
jgi:hypothetical protein